VSSFSPIQSDGLLPGKRVAAVGKLASMSRREAEKLIRDAGGQVVELPACADIVVVADDVGDWRRARGDRAWFDDAARAAVDRGELEIIPESELWSRLGLVDAEAGVACLYTPAMLADLLRVPITAIRHWQRRGALRATREVRRLAYFDFEEVSVARKLAQLLEAGCTLSVINRKLDELARLLPAVPRPLADPAVVVEGSCLYVQRGEGLTEPSGQLLIDFESTPRAAPSADSGENRPVTIPFTLAELCGVGLPRGQRDDRSGGAADELRSLAAELEEAGRPDQAIEVYRSLLFSGEYRADDHFALAELLYSRGDLAGARERYYVAIELDEDFVEARSNLGCLLAEAGEFELAEAAFRGALEYHREYADAHYHLARLLDRINQADEAVFHWQRFLSLAPASPWADEAGDRIAEESGRRSAIGARPDGTEGSRPNRSADGP